MNSIRPDVEDVDYKSQRPELSPEDKLVSSHLEDCSEVYCDLVRVQNDVWKNPDATAHFRNQRWKADNPKAKDRKAFFLIMCNIGDEINAASGGALRLPRSNARVLDLCMAPGGYTASVLKHSPHAIICALTLPQKLGGHPILLRRRTPVTVKFEDITMLYKEFGVAEIPQDHPEFLKFSDKRWWDGKLYDLVFCDGQALRTHEPHIGDYRRQVEATRLTISQLILSMQRLESGGTLIMLLHDVGSYETIKILSVFDKIAEILLFKPERSHKKRGTFYLIAKNVQPGHPDAAAAVDEWKKRWKDLTFPSLSHDGREDPPNGAGGPELAREVSDLLKEATKRIVELGEPIWQIQKETLATATWTKKKTSKDTEGKRHGTDEASTATVDNAAVDCKKGLDDVGTVVPPLGSVSTPMANDRAKSVDESVAM